MGLYNHIISCTVLISFLFMISLIFFFSYVLYTFLGEICMLPVIALSNLQNIVASFCGLSIKEAI